MELDTDCLEVDERIEKDAVPPAAPMPGHPTSLDFQFTGSGAEYFRIWIVNLLLTVATAGIYSAWAKTRRLQYFYRNTHLAGASFDFAGNPKAILRGRIVALLLLGAWHYAFGLSLAAGIATAALLLASLPFLMRSALRFRLANTVYRGLPFGFDGRVRDAYLAYLPPVLLFLLPGAAFAFIKGNQALIAAAALLYLCWPLMHGAMRCFQHRNLRYGDQRVEFSADVLELAGPYLLTILIAVGLAFFISLVMALKSHTGGTMLGTLVVAGIFAYVLVLVVTPYTSVRINNLAWSSTSFPGVAISCRMRVRSYVWLQVGNVVLTLLTLGLYRPFAVVRMWRYRLSRLTISAPDGFDAACMQAVRPPATAAGDGAADFLGPDISW